MCDVLDGEGGYFIANLSDFRFALTTKDIDLFHYIHNLKVLHIVSLMFMYAFPDVKSHLVSI